MHRLLLAATITLFTTTAALAAGPSCDEQAAEKKLSGAAKNSFVQKCVKDATGAK